MTNGPLCYRPWTDPACRHDSCATIRTERIVADRVLSSNQPHRLGDTEGPTHTLCPHQSCATIRASRTSDQRIVAFLLRNIDAIRQDQAAGDIHHALTRLATRVERAVDNHQPDLFVGPCNASAVTTTGDDSQTIRLAASVCGADLMARLGDIQVHCPKCGATYRVADRREEMLAAVRGIWATASVIANGLTGLDVPLTPSMVRQMAFRKEIFRMPNPDPDAPPYYLVGDVTDVLARRAERRQRKERAG
jgi:hypothetical protein